MKHFGIVQSFNEATGHGFIRPDEGGEHLRFARKEILWDPMVSPRPGVRLSYRLSSGDGHASAMDLETVQSSERQTGTRHKSFSAFRTAAEEVATRAELDEWDNEGGHMGSEPNLSLSTPDANERHYLERTTEMIEHTFAADWRRIALPLALAATVAVVVAAMAFMPQS
jgi:cold shock CspA family protein